MSNDTPTPPRRIGRPRAGTHAERYPPEQIAAGERLHRAILHNGFSSIAEFVRAHPAEGFEDQTVRTHASGTRGMSATVAMRYAALLSTTPEWILFGTGYGPGEQPPPVGLPVVYIAAAGLWQDSLRVVAPTEFVPIPAHCQSYGGQDTFGVKLETPDMDRRFPPGSILICVSYLPETIELKTGQIALIERRSDFGVERVVREIRLIEGQIWLWPDSKSPLFQQPWALHQAAPGETITIAAIAISVTHPLMV